MGIKQFVRLAMAPLLLGCASAAHAEEQSTPPPLDAQAAPAAQPAPPATDAQAAPAVQPGEVPAASTGDAASTVQSAPSKKKWHFATIGYVWFAGAWGETDVIKPLPPVDLRLPFGKVLKAFKFAFMGAAEAQHDRFVVLGDLTFIHLDARQGIGIRDPDFLKAELDSRTAEVTLLPGYRVVNKGPLIVDLLAGARMNWFKINLQLRGPNREAAGDVKHDWLDPLIGTRIAAPLGGKWTFGFYGDLGGFGIGSKITWQAVPTINYQINHKMTVGAGWRYFKVNYRTGDFLYNVHQSGPMITLRSAF